MRSCARAGARIGSAWTKRIRAMARRSVVGGKSDRATANRRRSSDVIVARGIRIPSLRREEFKIGCDQRRHRWEGKKEEVTAARDCRVICNPQGSSTGNDILL